MTETELTNRGAGLSHELSRWERAAWDRGYEAEQHSVAAEMELSRFIYKVLEGERRVQIELGRPPLSREHIERWFGPEFVEESDPV